MEVSGYHHQVGLTNKIRNKIPQEGLDRQNFNQLILSVLFKVEKSKKSSPPLLREFTTTDLRI